ncbi:centromere protein B [Perkinsela sp. CCAP 1560/4]|nr:centromere protein B [Perkinsela sp. CCAP 1560/4]|eukprot:KNH04150.1 centromere protein B [Perkinsela sp. CCAP 1560/4]
MEMAHCFSTAQRFQRNAPLRRKRGSLYRGPRFPKRIGRVVRSPCGIPTRKCHLDETGLFFRLLPSYTLLQPDEQVTTTRDRKEPKKSRMALLVSANATGSSFNGSFSGRLAIRHLRADSSKDISLQVADGHSFGNETVSQQTLMELFMDGFQRHLLRRN